MLSFPICLQSKAVYPLDLLWMLRVHHRRREMERRKGTLGLGDGRGRSHLGWSVSLRRSRARGQWTAERFNRSRQSW